MRSTIRIILGLVFVLATSRQALAKCDPTTEPDATDVANARAAVAANCDCAGAANHGDYVSCAAEQANANLQNNSCRGLVKKCAAKSTCGKPGFVTCCVTKNDKTKCKTKSSEEGCVAPPNGTACVGHYTSCCDACSNGMCTPTTTIAPTTTVP